MSSSLQVLASGSLVPPQETAQQLSMRSIEKYASSLRQSKTRQLIKEMRIQSAIPEYDLHDLDNFSDLHPGLTCSYIPITDKLKLIVGIMEDEIEQGLKSVDLLKVCIMIRQLLAQRKLTSVPCREMLNEGLFECLMKLLKGAPFSSVQILGEATWIVVNLSSYSQVIQEQQIEIVPVLFELILHNWQNPTMGFVVENAFWSLYNIVLENAAMSTAIFDYKDFHALLLAVLEMCKQPEKQIIRQIMADFMCLFFLRFTKVRELRPLHEQIIQEYMLAGPQEELIHKTIAKLFSQNQDPYLLVWLFDILNIKHYLFASMNGGYLEPILYIFQKINVDECNMTQEEKQAILTAIEKCCQ